MEIDKFKKWMDAAQQFQSHSFWNNIFDTQNNQNPSQNSLASISELYPKCDVYETEKELIVEAEIPGITKENLHISIHQQLITIAGGFNTFRQNTTYYVKERVNRKFKKEIPLPYPVDIQQVKSEIRYGILTIIMPINREEIEDIPISYNPPFSE